MPVSTADQASWKMPSTSFLLDGIASDGSCYESCSNPAWLHLGLREIIALLQQGMGQMSHTQDTRTTDTAKFKLKFLLTFFTSHTSRSIFSLTRQQGWFLTPWLYTGITSIWNDSGGAGGRKLPTCLLDPHIYKTEVYSEVFEKFSVSAWITLSFKEILHISCALGKSAHLRDGCYLQRKH